MSTTMTATNRDVYNHDGHKLMSTTMTATNRDVYNHDGHKPINHDSHKVYHDGHSNENV